jgi:hypothetical protein
MEEIQKDVTAGLGFCVLLLLLAMIFAEIIHLAGLAPPL